MALMDKVKGAANSAMQQATDAARDAMTRDAEHVRTAGGSGVLQGMLGNYTELSLETAQRQYGMYLMEGERFTNCFALLRDKMLFTDKRLIFIDHMGMSGQKVRVDSINLSSIIAVNLETGGMGFDHAELSFTYFACPYYKAHEVSYASKTLEFPKGFPVQSLYSMLQGLAYRNIERLNA